MISLVDKLKESQAELANFFRRELKDSRLEEEKKADVTRIANLESQVELHKSEVLKLEENMKR